MDKIMVDDEKAEPHKTALSAAEPDETDDLLYWVGCDNGPESANPMVDGRFIL